MIKSGAFLVESLDELFPKLTSPDARLRKLVLGEEVEGVAAKVLHDRAATAEALLLGWREKVEVLHVRYFGARNMKHEDKEEEEEGFEDVYGQDSEEYDEEEADH